MGISGVSVDTGMNLTVLVEDIVVALVLASWSVIFQLW